MACEELASDVTAVDVKPTRHILGLSGGKDSAALAIYLKDQGRDDRIEYFFCDTGAELREVYDYLDRLEDYLAKPIERLSSGRDFDHHLKRFNGFLPAPHARWCTRVMKLEPLEAFVGDDPCVSYIGIRADEQRQGYISHKPNIKAAYPFIDDGIVAHGRLPHASRSPSASRSTTSGEAAPAATSASSSAATSGSAWRKTTPTCSSRRSSTKRLTRRRGSALLG